jgi:hypothetical protein
LVSRRIFIAAIKQNKTMKKLTTLTAGVLLGFGLVSCDGDKGGASTDDKKTPAKEEAAKPDSGPAETAETVSLKVTGMT